jgi:uncharacterized protein (TIGR03437 family)
MTARCTRGILAVASLLTGASLLSGQPAPLTIVIDSLPAATLGASYSYQLVTTGGRCSSDGKATSTIDAGTLPPGMSITSPTPTTKQWFLQGTPAVTGTFSFTIHLIWTYNRVSAADTDCTDIAIKPLTLTVQGGGGPGQSLAVDRQVISAIYSAGASPPAAAIVQVTSTAGATPITAQATTDSGGAWLSVTPQNATTPAALSIGYSAGGLAQGTYTGRVTVTSGSLPGVTINVSLQVITGSNLTLLVDRQTVATAYHLGTFQLPQTDTVQVTSTGGAVAITSQSVTDSGGAWLSATLQNSTTPSPLSISYSISGLAQGTYTGRVTVTSGSLPAVTINVSLQVIADTVQLKSTPTSLVFTSILGGPDPPAQPVAVTVTGQSRLFQASVSAPPNGKWLAVSPAGAATPATLAVSVTAKDLAAATYNGTLTVAVNGVPGSSVTIPVTFTIQAPVQRPAITAGGVLDGAGYGPRIAPGTFISLFGTALSATTRAWTDADFVNGRLPTSLDGVSVTINGKSAAVAFISPTQINALAADDTVTGLVPVVVKNTVATSDSVLALQQTAAPAMFQFPGTKYAIGVHADGSALAGPALVQLGFSGTAAHVGEIIVLFGTGFGATLPASAALDPVTGLHPLAHPEEFSLRIGGVDAVVQYAGLITPGLYQFNVVVPNVPVGDQPVVAELRGLLSQSGLLLTIQK